MKKDFPMYGLVLLIIFGVLFLLAEGILSLKSSNVPLNIFPPATAEHQSSVSPLWIKDNIYIQASEHTQLAVADGKLVYIGSNSTNTAPHVYTVEVKTGNIVWEYGDQERIVSLAASGSQVYIGGVGWVNARNLDDGKKIWSKFFFPDASITKLLTINNVLCVDTARGDYYLLAEGTGETLKAIAYSIDGMPNDEIPLWSDYRMDLEHIDGDMFSYILSGRTVPEIGAMDIHGIKYWNTNVQATSRISASPLGIFVLATDGWVIRLDPQTGAKTKAVQFLPAPAEGDNTYEYGYYEYGYYVAVDMVNKILFVYLGDSAQLFAFQL